MIMVHQRRHQLAAVVSISAAILFQLLPATLLVATADTPVPIPSTNINNAHHVHKNNNEMRQGIFASLWQLIFGTSPATATTSTSSTIPSSPPVGPLPDPPIENDINEDEGICSNSNENEDGKCTSSKPIASTPSPSSSYTATTNINNIPPSSAAGIPKDLASPSGAYYCPNKESINYNHYSFYNTLECFYDTPSSYRPNEPRGDFVSPDLLPGEVAPIVWRDTSKVVTQYAYQVGLPNELIDVLLEYTKELGIIDLMRGYTTTNPVEAKEANHNGKFINLTHTNSNYGDIHRNMSWYVQRPQKKWQSNMHWISPANEQSHEDYLRILAKGNFDIVLNGIGKALKLDSLAVYQMTFIGVSHSVRGFEHHDTRETNAGVYNVIIPLLLEDDVDPELILWDDLDMNEDETEHVRGGYKYKVGVGAMMGDDAIHGTYECDYRNMTNAQHGGWIEDTDKESGNNSVRRRRSGMRLAATVYIAEIYPENAPSIAKETLTQIFPLRDEKWLLSQEARHWQDPKTTKDEYMYNTMKNDVGRKAYRIDDDVDDCEERVEEGMCESDVDGTREQCLFSCKVYIQEGVTRVEKKTRDENEIEVVNVCTQNRTGLEECQMYQDDANLSGDFISPHLKPGELFPFVWRDDVKQVTPYAFQIGVPPELTRTLLEYCNELGLTDTMRDLVGDEPLELDPSDPNGMNYFDEFVELKDGNDWYIQRPPSKWKNNMHWISPANEKTHEEYLKVLGRGNFDLVLQSIGKYLGLESLAVYHLTFIGVSYSEKGFIHRDTHHTGASVYNVIIPLLLEDYALPELELQDWDESRHGTFKYQVGTAAMMGDDAMHGTQACDYREKKGMRLAATVYIADINEDNAGKIAKQTLTQIFPLSKPSWLMAQSGRHWVADGDRINVEKTSLADDKGRKYFAFKDLLPDCNERAAEDKCESDEYTRKKCLKSCNIYEDNKEEEEQEEEEEEEEQEEEEEEEQEEEEKDVVLPEFEELFNEKTFKVGQYLDALFQSLPEDESCIDEDDECEESASKGMCMTDADEMKEMGCHRSCLFCLTPSSREMVSLGLDQIGHGESKDGEDSEDLEEKSDTSDETNTVEDRSPLPSDVLKVLAGTEYYFITEVLVDDDLQPYRLSCQNFNKNCALWASNGNCDKSEYSGFMSKNCPAACQRCPLVDLSVRCPIDKETNAIDPGDLNDMFERWLKEAGQDPSLYTTQNLPTGGKHPYGQLTVITSPYHDATQYPKDEDSDEDDDEYYKEPLPWVISMDDFLSDEECDRLIKLGEAQGYKQSTEYGDETNIDGSVTFVEKESRTSTNAWCASEDCKNDPIVKGVIDRITKMTGIPSDNYESLQLVRYEEGQFYEQHHDLSVIHEKYQYGPRILTFFFYLNDVESGGGTEFKSINFTAMPKKGTALVWPSVTDDLTKLEDWTWHAALPVNKGIKYGANAWVHMRDYQNTPSYCQ